MPRKFDPHETLGPNAIRAWRKSRSLTLEECASRMTDAGVKITRTSLSRIEKQLQPYNQRKIEALAVILECTPADLVVAAAADEVRVRDLLSHLAPDDRDRVVRMVSALVR